MKPRRIYYRKKGKCKTIIEGKQNGKTIFIWTLPDPEILIKEILAKSSFLPLEKSQKLIKKVQRLDFKENKDKKESQKFAQ